jgi:hypothetical protein
MRFMYRIRKEQADKGILVNHRSTCQSTGERANSSELGIRVVEGGELNPEFFEAKIGSW